MKNVLHLLTGGGVGGIETLISNYAEASNENNIFVFAWNGGENAKKIEGLGKKVFVLNINNKKPKLYLSEVLRICADYKIQIIVSHHNAPLTEWVLHKIHKARPDIKIVFYTHCDAKELSKANHKLLRGLNKWLIWRGLKEADLIIAISEYVKQSIINEYRIDSSKIITIYNAIPIKEYYDDIKKDFNSPIKIIYVGRLVKEKGVELTLRALSKVVNKNYKFLIVGDGPYKDKLKSISKELHIYNKVKFLGERNDVPELLKKANIFIHVPFCEEGFGITIVEAMSAGKLCICARSGAIPEIIKDKVGGLLINQFDEKQLVQTIDLAIDEYDTDAILQIRENGQNQAKKYDITKYADILDRNFENL